MIKRWFPIHEPAFRWGLLHPFGPPAPWWSDERRLAWLQTHDVPWKEKK